LYFAIPLFGDVPVQRNRAVSITVFLAIAGIFLSAIKIRFRDFNEKPRSLLLSLSSKGAAPNADGEFHNFTSSDGRNIMAQVESFDGSSVTTVREDDQRSPS